MDWSHPVVRLRTTRRSTRSLKWSARATASSSRNNQEICSSSHRSIWHPTLHISLVKMRISSWCSPMPLLSPSPPSPYPKTQCPQPLPRANQCIFPKGTPFSKCYGNRWATDLQRNMWLARMDGNLSCRKLLQMHPQETLSKFKKSRWLPWSRKIKNLRRSQRLACNRFLKKILFHENCQLLHRSSE